MQKLLITSYAEYKAEQLGPQSEEKPHNSSNHLRALSHLPVGLGRVVQGPSLPE